MGRSNTSLRGRLPWPKVRVDDGTLTRFAGLIPVIRYMTEVLEIPQRLVLVVGPAGRRRKYAVHHVLFAFLAASLTGIEKLTHLEWLRNDAVIEKFLRLPGWPVRKVFSRALAGLTEEAVQRLADLVGAVGLWTLDEDSVVVDADSTTLACYGEQEGAIHGYCSRGRNRRRHEPYVASVASSRAVIKASYRDGSKATAEEEVDFVRSALAQVLSVRPNASIIFRADSGFSTKAMLRWLLEEGVPFALSYPMRAGLKLMLVIAEWKALEGDDDIEAASLAGSLVGLDERLTIAAIRRRVHDPKHPPQGKTIDHSPGWRYQAVVTSEDWEPADVWRFYNGRADCERIFKVGKQALGLSWLVGHSFVANTVAFLLRLLAYNADVHYQLDVERQARLEDRPVVVMGLQARQIRFYNAAGRLLREANRWVLRLSDNRRVEALWRFYAPELLSG